MDFRLGMFTLDRSRGDTGNRKRFASLLLGAEKMSRATNRYNRIPRREAG
jgi:hypothetical protein